MYQSTTQVDVKVNIETGKTSRLYLKVKTNTGKYCQENDIPNENSIPICKVFKKNSHFWVEFFGFWLSGGTVH